MKGFEVNAVGEGHWHVISNNLIILKLPDENVWSQITSGYIADREIRISIINENEVQIYNKHLYRIDQ